MQRSLAFVALLALLSLGPLARGQDAPPAAGARGLEERYEAYRAKQLELGRLALELRGAQQRYMGARRALHAFREGKSPDELRAASAKVDALEAELLAARQAYDGALQGEVGRRYRSLKGELDATLRGLASALSAKLRVANDPALRRLRAALFVDKGRFGLAERDLEQVLSGNPSDPAALTLRGRCLEAKGRTAAALADYERALQVEGNDERRVRAAVASFWLNGFQRALELRQGVEDPSKLPAQLQLDFQWYLAAPRLEEAAQRWAREEQLRARDAERADLPRVELVTNKGRVLLELFEDQAPGTVANFVELVEAGFYTGLPWHRVQPLRLAASGKPREPQGGDAEGPGYAIAGESQVEQARHHFRGSLGCLIRGPDRRGGSQFYVLLRPDHDLDGQCTVFGRVLEGLEVVATLEEGDTIQAAKVVRKRAHPYQATRLPLGGR